MATNRGRSATIPPWCVVGAVVDYHATVGGPVTQPGMTVRAAPFVCASGIAVAFLGGKAGYVAVAALTPAKEAEVPDAR